MSLLDPSMIEGNQELKKEGSKLSLSLSPSKARLSLQKNIKDKLDQAIKEKTTKRKSKNKSTS